jgi:hypothetical protein
MKRSSRQLLAPACVVLITLTAAHAQVIRPDRVREGDSKTRNVTVETGVNNGERVSISVSYSADPASAAVDFIPRFEVQDNGPEDRDPQAGSIHLLLPRAFDRIGQYTVVVRGKSLKFVHERNNSSYVRQFVDWLVGAAGSGERGLDPKSAAERIQEAIKTSRQSKLAIWTAPLPPVGEQIKPPLSKRISAAVMPAWSPKGTELACSAWRNDRWVIAAYKIGQMGDGVELWQWNSGQGKSSDFSPVWSPNGDAIAFVRLNENRQSDIWVLELDRKLRPKKEAPFTRLGNVQAVFGWDKDLGLLFETKSSVRQLWALKVTAGAANTPTPVSDLYDSFNGSAPLRKTLIYADQNNSPPPNSIIYEMNAGVKKILLTGNFCTYRWPSVSRDEKWLALESDCPG